MKIWEYNYNGQSIIVKNTVASCELLINGSLADQKKGIMAEAVMVGTLKDGERVTAELRSGLTVSCYVHVGDILQHPIEKNKIN